MQAFITCMPLCSTFFHPDFNRRLWPFTRSTGAEIHILRRTSHRLTAILQLVTRVAGFVEHWVPHYRR